MSLNEILLIIAVLVVVTILYFFMDAIKQPLVTYIRLTAGVLLLILVWFFSAKAALPIKILMSVIVVSSAVKTIKDYLNK